MENASEYPKNVPRAHNTPPPYANARIANNRYENPPPPYLNAAEFSTLAAETTTTANQESEVAPKATFADTAVLVIRQQKMLDKLHQEARQHYKNYTVSKCPTDLDTAISTAESAREGMREFSGAYEMLCDDLGTMYFTRYMEQNVTKDIADLRSAIAVAWEIGNATWKNNRCRPDQLYSFSQMLYRQFIDDEPVVQSWAINLAIKTAEEAIEALDYPYTDKLSRASKLERLGQDKPKQHKDERLLNLRWHLMRLRSSRYQKQKAGENFDLKAQTDLDVAIDLGYRIMKDIPASHPERDLIRQGLDKMVLRREHDLKSYRPTVDDC